MNDIHKQTEALITWAAEVAEKAGHNVTTTEVLAKVVLKVNEGKDINQIKENILGGYTDESKNSSYRM